MWDNRSSAHRAIPGSYKQPRRGVRTTVFGAKPVFDPTSESRAERAERLERQEVNGAINGKAKRNGAAKEEVTDVPA